MSTVTKEASLDALGLPSGDHWVKFYVEETISFEVTASVPSDKQRLARRKPTDFVKRWGGSAPKVTNLDDGWLTHINEKHLR